MSLLVDQALELADAGQPVFPCRSNKSPACAHGYKDATTDPDEIEKLFAHRSAKLIGLATGEASGIVVVDIDVKNGKDGRQWPRYQDLPQTKKVQTASGGFHFYFKHPGREIKSRANVGFNGLDIRGDGGYVISPPSPGYSIVADEDIAEMPQWLVDHCTEPEAKTGGLDLGLPIDVTAAIAEVESEDGEWFQNVFRLTAHWIGHKFTDAEMLAFAPAFTRKGYTVDQTRGEMMDMIKRGRKKWDEPDPVHEPDAAKCRGFTLGDIQAWDLKPARMFNDWLSEGLTLLGGRPKAGKSHLAERAAVEIGKQQSVLHYALEYGPLMLQERMRDYGNVSPRLRLYHEGALDRLDQGGLDQLKREIDANEADLVVIDTFAKVKRPGDAKGYEAEYQAIGDLKRLVDETGVAVLALHHTRKPSHEDAGTIFDTFLGSSALSAGPDMLLIFDDRGDTLKLHGKGRLVEEFQFPLRWADPGFEIDEPDAALRDKAPLQYRIKSHLRQAGPCSNKELSQTIGKPLNSVTNATGKLFYAGDIQRLPDGRFQTGV
ncbi:MAG: AAA family ATPase [Alphaproteobacteria bacterium]|nr:AAA family ATPase [Alphaproteobacteria bacterium]